MATMAVVRGFRWGRALSFFLSLWVICLLYFLLVSTRHGETETELRESLRRAQDAQDKLTDENAKLRKLLKEAQDALKQGNQVV